MYEMSFLDKMWLESDWTLSGVMVDIRLIRGDINGLVLFATVKLEIS